MLRGAIQGAAFVALMAALTMGVVRAPWLLLILAAWTATHGDRRCVDRFSFVKGLGLLVGLAIILACHGGWAVSYPTAAAAFAMNVLVATLYDPYVANAAAGVILLRHLDYDAAGQCRGALDMAVPPAFIGMYVAWNAAFSYATNYSWRSRLILVSDVVVCAVEGDTRTWIAARCISLTLNMMMRAADVSIFYDAGRTWMATVPRSEHRHRAACRRVGLANLAAVGAALAWRRSDE